MKAQDFIQAVQILTAYHSNEVVINSTKSNSVVVTSQQAPTLHIRGCVPAAINKLIEAGFSLGMKDGLMSVDKY